ncbi:hypothetical protein OJ253_3658 [Cryptosporidium canis]|uniref:Uncharacterized protein n=1 Tax=Cryptosporidium canis TaxID=195482 RepID=A0A9D5HUK2_9CRYT|nr:hypothetical protein OJ253_3658 [Cryptosporidium canis]
MSKENYRNFVILIITFIGAIENFYSLDCNKYIYPICFARIKALQNFVNPFRNKVVVWSYCDEKIPSERNESNCCNISLPNSKRLSRCKFMNFVCNKHLTNLTEPISCCINNKGIDDTESSESLPNFTLYNIPCLTRSCISCIKSCSNSNTFRSGLSPSKNNSKFYQVRKNCFNKNFMGCKCCNIYGANKFNYNYTEYENEQVGIDKFNDSSDVTSEPNTSEIMDPNTSINTTSNSSEVISYDTYLKFMDKYPLFSINRENYIRAKKGLISNKGYGLWEIHRVPESSTNETNKLFLIREQYLGLTTNHTNKNTSAIELAKFWFVFPKDNNYKDQLSFNFSNSTVIESMNWNEWERVNKENNEIILNDRLKELFNGTANSVQTATISNISTQKNHSFSHLNLRSNNSNKTYKNIPE